MPIRKPRSRCATRAGNSSVTACLQKAINHAVEGGEGGHHPVASLDKIAGTTGRRPRGWLSPGLTRNRRYRRYPEAERNRLCLHDWVVDDRPSWMKTTAGALIADAPIILRSTDSVIYAIERHAIKPERDGEAGWNSRFAEFELEVCRDQRDLFLAIGLHPHLISVPHRIPRTGAHARSADGIVQMSASLRAVS